MYKNAERNCEHCNQNDKLEKYSKKRLTNRNQSDKIVKLSKNSTLANRKSKTFKKNLEKGLDKKVSKCYNNKAVRERRLVGSDRLDLEN